MKSDMKLDAKTIAVAGLLIGIGILIPAFSPFRVIIEPASFTLASHVPIFIAMLISPAAALAVALGTAAGFLIGGFPIIVVLRAASHIVFAHVGSFYLHKLAKEMPSRWRLRLFSFLIALIHALGELVVVSVFYFGGYVGPEYFEKGFATAVLLMVGVGTVIHGMVDFEMAWFIYNDIKKAKTLIT